MSMFSFFDDEITKEQYEATKARIESGLNLPDKEQLIKLIRKYEQQQKEAEENIKSGLKAALNVLKTFLPKNVKNAIPANAIDLLFGIIHNPAVIVDKLNEFYQKFAEGTGVPVECIRLFMQKPGSRADTEAIIAVYNPNLQNWVYIEYKFRDIAEALKPNGDKAKAIKLREQMSEAYQRTNTALETNNG